MTDALETEQPPRTEYEAREFLIESIFMMRRTAIELRRRADKLDALSFDLGAVLGADLLDRIRSPGAPPGPSR